MQPNYQSFSIFVNIIVQNGHTYATASPVALGTQKRPERPTGIEPMTFQTLTFRALALRRGK